MADATERLRAAQNTDPPDVRCGLCGGPCKPWRNSARWIECAGSCSWSSHDPRRTGWWWRFRVFVGM